MKFILFIRTFISSIKLYFFLMGKNEDLKFQHYKEKGIRFKKDEKQFAKALKFYKKALNYAATNENKAEVWHLILHIHTDKTIGTSEQILYLTGQNIQWPWGPNNVPSNYERPPQKELLK